MDKYEALTVAVSGHWLLLTFSNQLLSETRGLVSYGSLSSVEFFIASCDFILQFFCRLALLLLCWSRRGYFLVHGSWNWLRIFFRNIWFSWRGVIANHLGALYWTHPIVRSLCSRWPSAIDECWVKLALSYLFCYCEWLLLGRHFSC